MKTHYCPMCGVDSGSTHRPWCEGKGRFDYYLSAHDLADRHEELIKVFPPEDDVVYSCGGTWSFDGPPCGGCADCAHGMISHGFGIEQDEARMFHEAGFEYADPRVIDVSAMMSAGGGFRGFEKHGPWDCKTELEDERWPKSESSSLSTGSGEASTE